jgi:hypothetical protein
MWAIVRFVKNHSMKLNDLSYPIELGKITSAHFFVDTETPIYVCGDGSLLISTREHRGEQ